MLTKPGFDFTAAPLSYGNSGIREWILRFKHGGRRDLAPVLARVLGAVLLGREGAGAGSREGAAGPAPAAGDVFVPVPLHPARRFERGYDQAALLARAIAFEFEGHALGALRRRRATPSQGDLLAPSRFLNVRDAFAVRGGLKGWRQGPRVWIVDDVVTSGATVSACARALKRKGFGAVGVLALARAEARGESGAE